MTTSTNPSNNGRVGRKSLASQIDRLDNMLDGLADGLNEAVADAVKDAVAGAVREAVRAVLSDVFTNPELLARLRGAPVATAEPAAIPTATVANGPTLRQRLGRLWAGIRTCGSDVRRASCEWAGRKRADLGHFGRRLMTLWSCRSLLARFKYPLLAGLVVGVTVGVAAWFAGPFLAAVGSGVGGFATTLAVQAGLWLRRVMSMANREA